MINAIAIISSGDVVVHASNVVRLLTFYMLCTVTDVNNPSVLKPTSSATFVVWEDAGCTKVNHVDSNA